jgi:hypothetical protein
MFDFITTQSMIWGYRIRVAQHAHLLGCDILFLGGWFLVFQTIMCLHVQALSSLRRLDPKGKDTTVPHNVSNCSNKCTSNPGRPEVPSVQLHPQSTEDYTWWLSCSICTQSISVGILVSMLTHFRMSHQDQQLRHYEYVVQQGSTNSQKLATNVAY